MINSFCIDVRIFKISFLAYGVRVEQNLAEPKVDLTAYEDPANKKQEKVLEKT